MVMVVTTVDVATVATDLMPTVPTVAMPDVDTGSVRLTPRPMLSQATDTVATDMVATDWPLMLTQPMPTATLLLPTQLTATDTDFGSVRLMLSQATDTVATVTLLTDTHPTPTATLPLPTQLTVATDTDSGSARLRPMLSQATDMVAMVMLPMDTQPMPTDTLLLPTQLTVATDTDSGSVRLMLSQATDTQDPTATDTATAMATDTQDPTATAATVTTNLDLACKLLPLKNPSFCRYIRNSISKWTYNHWSQNIYRQFFCRISSSCLKISSNFSRLL